MEGSSPMGMFDFLAAGYNFLPSALFCIGLAALALGWVPKLGKLVYVYLTYSFLLNYFGRIVDLPEWLFKTSIQSWIPQMPIEDIDALLFITKTVISSVLMVDG